ncbi:MAG: hypothetical protein VKI63_04190 [Cyanobium sp.]|nr:hypothetical protein [Cyanobium sp.]
MATFIRPVIEQPCLSSSTGIQANWRNRPINLDLVLTFGPAREMFTYPREAGEVGCREPALAIRFDCVGGVTHAWFFRCAEDRDKELQRLCQC